MKVSSYDPRMSRKPRPSGHSSHQPVGQEVDKLTTAVNELARQALERIASALEATPPPGVSRAYVAAFFDRNLETLTESLARMIHANYAVSSRPELALVPISLRQASQYIAKNHRHHKPPTGAKFALGVGRAGQLAGVATVGRPVSRHLDDQATLEVTRVATDGTPNACSMLLGAAVRAARAIGYRRVYSYTLATEPGSSLRAAGFRLDKANAGGGSWSRSKRPRTDTHPVQAKQRWVWP